MEADDDYQLINVVRHLQYFMQNVYGDYQLKMEFKFGKPTEPVEGNKKFQQLLEKSHQHLIVMNANRQMKKKPYVRLTSMTTPEQFQWFQQNLYTLSKLCKVKKNTIDKLDLNTDKQKVTYVSDKQKWIFRNRMVLFKPNYETILNGKLFRISLYKQQKRDHEPKKKIVSMLEEVIDKTLYIEEKNKEIQKEMKKKQQKKEEYSQAQKKIDRRFWPLRFKRQTTYAINQMFEIAMSQVYQIKKLQLYEEVKDMVNNRKNSNQQNIGKKLLTFMIDSVLQEKDALIHEVELRLLPEIMFDFQKMHQQEIEQFLQKSALVFVTLAKDPHEFSAQEVLDIFQQIQKI